MSVALVAALAVLRCLVASWAVWRLLVSGWWQCGGVGWIVSDPCCVLGFVGAVSEFSCCVATAFAHDMVVKGIDRRAGKAKPN